MCRAQWEDGGGGSGGASYTLERQQRDFLMSDGLPLGTVVPPPNTINTNQLVTLYGPDGKQSPRPENQRYSQRTARGQRSRGAQTLNHSQGTGPGFRGAQTLNHSQGTVGVWGPEKLKPQSTVREQVQGPEELQAVALGGMPPYLSHGMQAVVLRGMPLLP